MTGPLRTTASAVLGFPSVKPGPVPGYVLVADRNNNRLLILSPHKKIVWQFPRPGDVRAGQSFHDPDDAFFTPGYRGISTNEEFNDQIALISIRRHRITWSYGHAGVAGSAPGELSNPDDAYLLSRQRMMVADIRNCRVLVVDRLHRILRSYGSPSRCYHHPPESFSSPNGATPLADGGVLVTEIGGWVDRLDRTGNLVYTVRTPTAYPSDAQLLPDGQMLVAGFNTPGRVDIISRSGAITWTYGPTSGPGSLDRPSLAVRWPNGMIAITDDAAAAVLNRRVFLFGGGQTTSFDGIERLDPATGAVKRVGTIGEPLSDLGVATAGSAAYLVGGYTGRAWATAIQRFVPGHRPSVVARLPAGLRYAGVAALGGRIYVVGGVTTDGTSSAILSFDPSRATLRRIRSIPHPVAHGALVALGRWLYLVGGTDAAGTPLATIIRIDPRTGESARGGTLPHPLADAGAAVTGGGIVVVGGESTRPSADVIEIRPT